MSNTQKNNGSRFYTKAIRCWFLITLITGSSFCLSANDKFRALLISSYHPAFPTFFQQIEGIKSVCDGYPIQLDIEFMDTKRFNDTQNRSKFRELLQYKLSKTDPYDIVLIADDNALIFALNQQNKLFKDIPIVFFGVNNIQRAKEQNSNSQVTGVVEAVSIKETLELMLQLQPTARKVIALVDSTSSGQGDLASFYEVGKQFTTIDFEEISLVHLSFAEFSIKLKTLSPKEAVLLLSAYHDKNNNSLSFEDSLSLILKNLSNPLYHLWYHGLGDGIMGGKMISHFHQGKTAGDLAIRILNGESIENIPVVETSPNQYMFDFNVLKKHQVAISQLPVNSIILNVPESFYEKYKKQIWVIILVFILLCILVISLTLSLMYRIRAEKKSKRCNKS